MVEECSLVTFAVAGKPRGKARPHATGSRGSTHVYTPAGTRAYERAVAQAAAKALDSRRPFDGPVEARICVRFRPPQRTTKAALASMLSGFERPTKKPDLDNVVKSIIDGCSGVVFRDDVDVVTIIAKKIYAVEEGVDVTISAIQIPQLEAAIRHVAP